MKNKLRASRCILLALVFLISIAPLRAAIALQQHEKLWTGLFVDHAITQDKKWHYLVFTQMRFIDQSHPWQMSLIEAGIGRVILPKNTLWLGYRWSAHNPNNGFYQSNMLWQQWVADMRDASQARILLRTRLEEILRGNRSPVSFRFRERFYMQTPFLIHHTINPVFSDEVLVHLNQTNYTSHHFISENRLFVGVNLLVSANSFWEVGYINQYQFGAPSTPANQMSHIFSVNYFII